MTYLNKKYIDIKWLQKKLVDKLYDGEITHNTMQIFIDLIADWRTENERNATSDSLGDSADDNADN